MSKNSASAGNNPDSAASPQQRTREPKSKSNLFFRSCDVYGWTVSAPVVLSYNVSRLADLSIRTPAMLFRRLRRSLEKARSKKLVSEA